MTDIAKVLDLMRSSRFCMLTTREGEELRSRPMTPQQISDTGDVWCFVSTDSDQAKQVAVDPHVNASFDDGSSWVSLSGTAEIVRDPVKIDELWDRAVQAWFPEGRESADLALIHVRGTSAEYWDTPGGTIAAAVAFVQSAITGNRPDVGENEAVDLPPGPGSA